MVPEEEDKETGQGIVTCEKGRGRGLGDGSEKTRTGLAPIDELDVRQRRTSTSSSTSGTRGRKAGERGGRRSQLMQRQRSKSLVTRGSGSMMSNGNGNGSNATKTATTNAGTASRRPSNTTSKLAQYQQELSAISQEINATFAWIQDSKDALSRVSHHNRTMSKRNLMIHSVQQEEEELERRISDALSKSQHDKDKKTKHHHRDRDRDHDRKHSHRKTHHTSSTSATPTTTSSRSGGSKRPPNESTTTTSSSSTSKSKLKSDEHKKHRSSRRDGERRHHHKSSSSTSAKRSDPAATNDRDGKHKSSSSRSRSRRDTTGTKGASSSSSSKVDSGSVKIMGSSSSRLHTSSSSRMDDVNTTKNDTSTNRTTKGADEAEAETQTKTENSGSNRQTTTSTGSDEQQQQKDASGKLNDTSKGTTSTSSENDDARTKDGDKETETQTQTESKNSSKSQATTATTDSDELQKDTTGTTTTSRDDNDDRTGEETEISKTTPTESSSSSKQQTTITDASSNEQKKEANDDAGGGSDSQSPKSTTGQSPTTTQQQQQGDKTSTTKETSVRSSRSPRSNNKDSADATAFASKSSPKSTSSSRPSSQDPSTRTRSSKDSSNKDRSSRRHRSRRSQEDPSSSTSTSTSTTKTTTTTTTTSESPTKPTTETSKRSSRSKIRPLPTSKRTRSSSVADGLSSKSKASMSSSARTGSTRTGTRTTTASFDNDDDDKTSTTTPTLSRRDKMARMASCRSKLYLAEEPEYFLDCSQERDEIKALGLKLGQLDKEYQDCKAAEAKQLEDIRKSHENVASKKNVIQLLQMEQEAYREQNQHGRQCMFDLHQETLALEAAATETFDLFVQLETIHRNEVAKHSALTKKIPELVDEVQTQQYKLQKKKKQIAKERIMTRLCNKYMSQMVTLVQKRSKQQPELIFKVMELRHQGRTVTKGNNNNTPPSTPPSTPYYKKWKQDYETEPSSSSSSSSESSSEEESESESEIESEYESTSESEDLSYESSSDYDESNKADLVTTKSKAATTTRKPSYDERDKANPVKASRSSTPETAPDAKTNKAKTEIEPAGRASPTALPQSPTRELSPTQSPTRALSPANPPTEALSPARSATSSPGIAAVAPAPAAAAAPAVDPEEQKRQEKERFLQFTKILVKYLETKDTMLHQKAKEIIKDVAERNKRKERGYESVTYSMRSRLKEVVPFAHWEKAELYLEHFLAQNDNEEANNNAASSSHLSVETDNTAFDGNDLTTTTSSWEYDTDGADLVTATPESSFDQTDKSPTPTRASTPTATPESSFDQTGKAPTPTKAFSPTRVPAHAPETDKVEPVPAASELVPTMAEQRELRQREKDRFLQFTRILLKYLETKDPTLHKIAEDIIKDCVERNKRREKGFESVSGSMRDRLKPVVGDAHWTKAESYLSHFLAQKEKETRQQAVEPSTQKEGTATPDASVAPATASWEYETDEADMIVVTPQPSFDETEEVSLDSPSQNATTKTASPKDKRQPVATAADQEKQEKERFLKFTQILVKYLEKKDPTLHKKCQDIIIKCAERHKRKEKGFESVTASMRDRLQQVVPEIYWKKAESYLSHRLAQKEEANAERDQQSTKEESPGLRGEHVASAGGVPEATASWEYETDEADLVAPTPETSFDETEKMASGGDQVPVSVPSDSGTDQADPVSTATAQTPPQKDAAEPVLTAVDQEKAMRREQDRFLQFTQILVKYLENKDATLHKQCQDIIIDCAERHKRKEKGYESVTISMRDRLKQLVPDVYWRKAESYHSLRLAQKEKAKVGAAQQSTEQLYPDLETNKAARGAPESGDYQTGKVSPVQHVLEPTNKWTPVAKKPLPQRSFSHDGTMATTDLPLRKGRKPAGSAAATSEEHPTDKANPVLSPVPEPDAPDGDIPIALPSDEKATKAVPVHTSAPSEAVTTAPAQLKETSPARSEVEAESAAPVRTAASSNDKTEKVTPDGHTTASSVVEAVHHNETRKVAPVESTAAKEIPVAAPAPAPAPVLAALKLGSDHGESDSDDDSDSESSDEEGFGLPVMAPTPAPAPLPK